MQKEQIFSAATVDRAIEKALTELHMDRDAVSVEVIEMGRKGFLGIGASDAKIRVTYEVPDEVKPAEKPATKVEEKPAPKAEAKPRPAQDDTPRLVKAAPQSAENKKPVQRPAARPVQDEEKPRLVRRCLLYTSGGKVRTPHDGSVPSGAPCCAGAALRTRSLWDHCEPSTGFV